MEAKPVPDKKKKEDENLKTNKNETTEVKIHNYLYNKRAHLLDRFK